MKTTFRRDQFVWLFSTNLSMQRVNISFFDSQTQVAPQMILKKGSGKSSYICHQERCSMRVNVFSLKRIFDTAIDLTLLNFMKLEKNWRRQHASISFPRKSRCNMTFVEDGGSYDRATYIRLLCRNPIFDELLDVGWDIKDRLYEEVLKLDTYQKIFSIVDTIDAFRISIYPTFIILVYSKHYYKHKCRII